MGPTDRVLQRGDVVIIDTCTTYDGYFCDFDRNWSIGYAADEVKRAYEAAWRATEAGLAVAKPGATCAELWLAMDSILGSMGSLGNNAGRMGHGLGLQLTEPPSLTGDDDTVLDVGPSSFSSGILSPPPECSISRAHQQVIASPRRKC